MAGDTAANAGMMELWATLPGAEGMPTWAKTVSASAGAAAFRVFLMPVDCLKTTMQVQGAEGMALLGAKIKGARPLLDELPACCPRPAPPTPRVSWLRCASGHGASALPWSRHAPSGPHHDAPKRVRRAVLRLAWLWHGLHGSSLEQP